jgi:RimJ/RimL family protein N-acetyltransferase
MPYDRITTSIAEQRRKTYLDDTERHRRARAVQQDSLSFQRSLLRAAAVRFRPIAPSDTGLLQDAFDRLSPESRQLRFLFPKTRLSPSELRYFTEVDHHDHEAIVALHRWQGRGLGVARYIRHRHDPHSADVAVTVIDEWHGRGLGTALVKRLMGRARCEGVRRFTANIASDNSRARRLLYGVSLAPQLLGYDDGVAEYEIALGPGATRTAAVGFPRLLRTRCSCA